jgi:DNA repair exonuclease SbcCD ATPase subunit
MRSSHLEMPRNSVQAYQATKFDDQFISMTSGCENLIAKFHSLRESMDYILATYGLEIDAEGNVSVTKLPKIPEGATPQQVRQTINRIISDVLKIINETIITLEAIIKDCSRFFTPKQVEALHEALHELKERKKAYEDKQSNNSWIDNTLNTARNIAEGALNNATFFLQILAPLAGLLETLRLITELIPSITDGL